MKATMQRAGPPIHQSPTQAVQRAAKPDALNLLDQFGITVTVEREHQIFRQGEPVNYCWQVLSGCVRTVKLMEDGRRALDEFLLPGAYIGFDDIDTHDLSAEAVSGTVLLRYPRRMVEALAKHHPGLMHRLRMLALSDLRTAHERTLLLGRKTAMEKISSFLLEMDRRLASPSRVIELPMTRTDIADHLGLTIETVCRLLAHLKREGTVAIHRTGIELCDRITLRALACEPRH